MPLTAIGIGAVAAPVIGGIMGQNAAQTNYSNAQQAQQNALNQYLGISAPGVAQQQLNLAQYQNAGNLTPQQIQTMQQGPNALAGIQTDPRLVQAQMAALQQLSTTGQMGMTPAEQAALYQAQQQAAGQAQAKNAQIENQFAAQGMGGSGAQLAAQLANSQNSAQMLGNNSNQVAQNAQQNAMQALAQSGQLGGQMQAQQFGQQAQIAQAQNYINQFNTANSQAVQNANVQEANAAQLRNLQNQQGIMGQNTQLSNQQQQYNKQLLQQQFNNQMALASGRAGQYQGIAQQQYGQAGNVANQYAGMGQGVGTGLAGLASAQSAPSGDLSNYFAQLPGQNTNSASVGPDLQAGSSGTTQLPASNENFGNYS
jgi:hypothetical protein